MSEPLMPPYTSSLRSFSSPNIFDTFPLHQIFITFTFLSNIVHFLYKLFQIFVLPSYLWHFQFLSDIYNFHFLSHFFHMFTFWWKPHHYRFTCHVSHFHSHFHTLCYVSHLSRVMYWPHLPQATKITHYNIWVRIYILYFEKKTDFHMKRCFLFLCCLKCMEPWDPELQFHCQCVTWHWTSSIQLKCLRICIVEILQKNWNVENFVSKIEIFNFKMHGT